MPLLGRGRGGLNKGEGSELGLPSVWNGKGRRVER